MVSGIVYVFMGFGVHDWSGAAEFTIIIKACCKLQNPFKAAELDTCFFTRQKPGVAPMKT